MGMTITVTDALRLKNDLARKIQSLQCTSFSCGKTTVDGVETGNTGDESEYAITEYADRLARALNYSYALNSILARFNVLSGVSDNVRDKSNTTLLMTIWQSALQRSEPRTTKGHQVVGDKRIVVETKFEPYLAKGFIKSKIKALRDQLRTLQTRIDEANVKTIDLPFTYADVDALSD